jgi:hypothetical protein
MGMVNDRCMVTRVCVYDVTALLLREQHDGSYRPCSLPVEGVSDNFGGVEIRREPSHLLHLTTGLIDAFRSGKLCVDFKACHRDAFVAGDNPPTVFRKIVAAADMDSYDDGRNVQLSGERLRVAMIATPVARALAAAAAATAADLELIRLLDWEGGARFLYREDESLLRDPSARTLAALQAALAHRGIEWSPAGRTTTQFSKEGERSALQDALKRFIHDLPIRTALLRYAHEQYFDDLTIEDILGTEWFERE